MASVRNVSPISLKSDPSELFLDDFDAGKVVLIVECQDLAMQLRGLGEIDLFGVDGEVPELLGEPEGAESVVEEL